MLTVTQRRIGLGCALLLAIAMTVTGEDNSPQADAPKQSLPSHRSRDASTPGSAGKPTRIEVASVSRMPPAANGVDVFAARSWATPRAVVRETAPPAPQAVAPPIPFEYVGQMEGRQGLTILLARGAESFAVKAGESIGNDYRLETVAPDALTIVYLPLNERQTLVLAPK